VAERFTFYKFYQIFSIFRGSFNCGKNDCAAFCYYAICRIYILLFCSYINMAQTHVCYFVQRSRIHFRHSNKLEWKSKCCLDWK